MTSNRLRITIKGKHGWWSPKTFAPVVGCKYFEPVPPEQMRAAGWAMDYRRDHDNRLYGALPPTAERRAA